MTLLARALRYCSVSSLTARTRQRWFSWTAPHSCIVPGSVQEDSCSTPDNVQEDSCSELQFFHEQHRHLVPLLDWHRLLDTAKTEQLQSQVAARKGAGDIKRVQDLYEQYVQAGIGDSLNVLERLIYEARRIPNRTRPVPPGVDEQGDSTQRPLEVVGAQQDRDFPVKEFSWRASRLGLLRLDGVGAITGNRTYFFLQELAELEAALVRYVLSHLRRSGFRLVSVPDMVSQEVLEGCGLHVHGERTMAYRVLETEGRDSDLFMSGTAEVALGSLLRGRSIYLGPDSAPRPLRLVAVSRCFRPEVSHLHSEGGVYRVHQFTKVEMFGVCVGELEHSEKLLEEFVGIQRDLFESLGLHFIVYEMPPHELGAPAYRKVDIEAWMPGRGLYGEVSSASNCSDYQSRRLCISRASVASKPRQQVHTVNGTACATPRLLTALVETYQCRDGDVELPPVLRPFMAGRTHLAERRHRRAIKRRHVDSYSVQMEGDDWPDDDGDHTWGSDTSNTI